MRNFYRKITDHPKTIFIVFAVLVVAGLIGKQFVSVNYDMNDYLPKESPSTQALDVMEAEYEGGIPNIRVMVKDVTIPEALEFKEKISTVDGVTDVTWLDDSADVEMPLSMQDQDTVETYYKDNAALFSVTVEDEKRVSAVSDIREIIGDENAMTGSAVSTAVATESTISEVARIAIFAVIFTIFVLAVTTTSWAEPVLVLLGLGVAILINSGSNIIFGEISFVTNAAGSILQLAVSLDYTVFLLHRFEECRRTIKDPKEAMIEALTQSTTSILSSGLTTVIGFLALCLMQFLIGPDLGLALAKGVAISLITTFILMPDLILATYRIMDKTHHRSFMPRFRKLGNGVCRIMFVAAAVFAVMIVPSYLASNSNYYYYGSSHIFGEGTQLGDDTAAIEEVFGKSDTYVLMVPKESTALQREMSEELQELPEVKSILSYVDTVGAEIPESYLDEGTLSRLNSDNYTRMVLSIDAGYEGEETFELVEEIRSIAQEYYPDQWYLAGEGVSTYDLMDTITADMVSVNLVAIGAVFVVLLLTMKSLSLPIILVLGIETAIWINLSIPYSSGTEVFYIAYLIISSIQLGATVDYAILFTDRYTQFRESEGKRAAVKDTISAVTVSVITSSSVLAVAGFLMGEISTHGLLSQLGYFLGFGAICSFIIVMFVLPGMLYVFDGVIQKTTKGLKFKKETKTEKNLKGDVGYEK